MTIGGKGMAVLHLMVGLPCSGKTTKAKKLEKEHNALLLSPGALRLPLYGNDTSNLRFAESIMWDHASRVLSLGVDVILDFGFLTKKEREMFRARARGLGVDFKIHYMDVPVNELYKRLEKRNKAAASQEFIISKEKMESYISAFEPPDQEELAGKT